MPSSILYFISLFLCSFVRSLLFLDFVSSFSALLFLSVINTFHSFWSRTGDCPPLHWLRVCCWSVFAVYFLCVYAVCASVRARARLHNFEMANRTGRAVVRVCSLCQHEKKKQTQRSSRRLSSWMVVVVESLCRHTYTRTIRIRFVAWIYHSHTKYTY